MSSVSAMSTIGSISTSSRFITSKTKAIGTWRSVSNHFRRQLGRPGRISNHWRLLSTNSLAIPSYRNCIATFRASVSAAERLGIRSACNGAKESIESIEGSFGIGKILSHLKAMIGSQGPDNYRSGAGAPPPAVCDYLRSQVRPAKGAWQRLCSGD